MTIWRELFGQGASGLDLVRNHLLEMIAIDRETFDLACTALLSSADVDTIGRQASDSDHKVNELVQRVRRELIVHASATTPRTSSTSRAPGVTCQLRVTTWASCSRRAIASPP